MYKFDKNKLYLTREIAKVLMREYPTYYKNIESCQGCLSRIIRLNNIESVNKTKACRRFSGIDAQKIYNIALETITNYYGTKEDHLDQATLLDIDHFSVSDVHRCYVTDKSPLFIYVRTDGSKYGTTEQESGDAWIYLNPAMISSIEDTNNNGHVVVRMNNGDVFGVFQGEFWAAMDEYVGGVS